MPFAASSFLSCAAGLVVADHADQIDGRAQRAQVVGDVGRAAEPDLFMIEHHDRHRRLG